MSTKETYDDLTVHLHAWPTRFYLGLIFSQVICVTAGSIMPLARKEVTNWEDHPSRDVQHTDSEDSVMPLASSQKEARGVAPPIPPHEGEAHRQQIQSSTTDTAHHREQSKVCCAKTDEVGERHPSLKCAAKMSHLET